MGLFYVRCKWEKLVCMGTLMHHTTPSRSSHNALQTPSISMYIYHTYVHCTHTHATYRQYACDLKTRVDLDTFIVQLFRISRFRVVVVNIDTAVCIDLARS